MALLRTIAVSTRDPSPATFLQLAAIFTIALGFLLFSIMGIVDGLKFRRVRFRFGVVILSTFRGLIAQIIGVFCALMALIGVLLYMAYGALLINYCTGAAGCYVTTPIIGFFANWAIILANGGIIFCFVDWVRRRQRELVTPEVAATTGKLAYSIPIVHRYVNDKLALAHERPMNRPEVESIMEFVEQHAPFVVLHGAKQVMNGKELDYQKLATVFLADARFRTTGQREHIALEAATEAYVVTRQSR